MSNKDANTTSLPEKWYKIIQKIPEFKETADAASEADLKKIIVNCEGNIYSLSQDEAADVKLSGAKEIAKSLSEPYREGRKFQQAKIQYALFLLEGKGVDLNSKDD